MLSREQITFIAVVGLAANAIYFGSRIAGHGTTAETSGSTVTTPQASTVVSSPLPKPEPLPPAPNGTAAKWDDAASVSSKVLACAEWGPIPDDEVSQAKGLLVASNLHERILVRENPSGGAWVVSMELPGDAKSRREAILKIKSSKMEIAEDPPGNFFAGPYTSESEARSVSSVAKVKIGIPTQIVIRQPPSRNTTFILTDVSDEPLMSFQRAAGMFGKGSVRASPCPGAFVRQRNP